MTLSQIWEQLCKKDGRLHDEEAKVEFTSANLKKLLEQVYEQGRLTNGGSSRGVADDLFDILTRR
jgi:hypothetical protein